jgi:hypothetical protein
MPSKPIAGRRCCVNESIQTQATAEAWKIDAKTNGGPIATQRAKDIRGDHDVVMTIAWRLDRAAKALRKSKQASL